MAAAAPKSLAELAALAGMDETLFADFKESEFDEFTTDLGLKVHVRVQLRNLFREIRAAAVVVTAQAKFQQFLQRVHGADALAGLESVPVSPLPQAVAFIRDRPGTPSREALASAVEAAYAKADSLLAEGPDPHGLTRDEMAAINLYIDTGMGTSRPVWCLLFGGAVVGAATSLPPRRRRRTAAMLTPRRGALPRSCLVQVHLYTP